MEKITETQLRTWLDQVTSGGISFSRMVELINEKKAKPEMKMVEIAKGNYAMCYYPNNEGEIDLFFCEILSMGDEYCKCKIFAGDTLNPRRLIRIASDVCMSDLRNIYEANLQIKTISTARG